MANKIIIFDQKKANTYQIMRFAQHVVNSKKKILPNYRMDIFNAIKTGWLNNFGSRDEWNWVEIWINEGIFLETNVRETQKLKTDKCLKSYLWK